MFLVCFSVVSPHSFASIRKKWLPEIRRSLQQQQQPHQHQQSSKCPPSISQPSSSSSPAHSNQHHQTIKSDHHYNHLQYHQIPPFILVGTQCDLRHDVKVLIELNATGQQPISSDYARSMATKMGAVTYIECSALTQKNLKVC